MDRELGWLDQYVKVGYFTDYRRQTRNYFATNETNYAFLWLNSITFANLDFVKEACPEAALLALLIRSEERLPMREAEPSLLDYATFAPSTGAIKGWPLAEGLSRLQDLTSRLVEPEEYSVDIVMPYCDEPLDGLLSRRTGYDDEWLSARAPFRHVN